jgi:hypothetical protein
MQMIAQDSERQDVDAEHSSEHPQPPLNPLPPSFERLRAFSIRLTMKSPPQTPLNSEVDPDIVRIDKSPKAGWGQPLIESHHHQRAEWLR